MTSWIIFAILSAVFAALVAIFGKIGLRDVDSTVATTIRAIIMAVFLVISSLVFGKWHDIGTISGKAFLFIALSGVAGAISWLFYFLSLKLGPASGVVALDRLSIVFVVILAALFLGETLSWKTGVGSILILGGAILMTIR
jgi:bacterial/archaeal transporter family protein